MTARSISHYARSRDGRPEMATDGILGLTTSIRVLKSSRMVQLANQLLSWESMLDVAPKLSGDKFGNLEGIIFGVAPLASVGLL